MTDLPILNSDILNFDKAGEEVRQQNYRFISDLFAYAVAILDDPQTVEDLEDARQEHERESGPLTNPVTALRVYTFVVLENAKALQDTALFHPPTSEASEDEDTL